MSDPLASLLDNLEAYEKLRGDLAFFLLSVPKLIVLKDREKLTRIYVVAFPALLQMRWGRNRNWFCAGVPSYGYPTMFLGLVVHRIGYWRWAWWKIRCAASYVYGYPCSRHHWYPKV
jgi:hypothetical protein